jgi:hypothetical protein
MTYKKWLNELDEKVEKWYNSVELGVPLHAYLGFSSEEYDVFLTRPREVFKKRNANKL